MPKFSPRVLKRLTMITVAVTVLIVLASAVGVWIGAETMVRPKRRPLEPRHLDVVQNPREYGLSLERFETVARDGVRLQCLLASRHPDPGLAERTRRMIDRLESSGLKSSPRPRGTVVFLHGRGGLKENMLTIAQRFVAADFRCVVYDARAHGESEGTFSTFGHHEKNDLSQVLDQVEKLLRSRNETTGPVYAFGLSLGASVLLQSIGEEPRILAGIAVAPFADLREQILFTGRRQVSSRLPSWVPLAITSLGSRRAGFRSGDISPVLSAATINCPVFVIHGTKDGVIPIDHSKRIFRALSHPGKQWREIPEGYHRNVLAEGGDDLYQEMIEFCLFQTRKESGSAAALVE